MLRFLSASLVTGLCCSVASAGVVFQADFDSESAIVSEGGSGSLIDRNNNATPAVVTGSELASGGGGFFRITRPANQDATAGNADQAQFNPTSANTWANTWYTDNAGDDTLVGGLDFFYRQNNAVQSANSFLFQLPPASGSDGLDLRLRTVNATTMRLQVKNQASNSLSSDDATFSFEADQLYHFAIVAEGDAGSTTLKLFIAEGNVAIDPTGTPAATVTVGDLDDGDNLSNSFDTAGADFRVTPADFNGFEDELRIDYDRLRIFDAVPLQFNAVPEPGSLALLGFSGVLMFCRRGRR